MDSLVLSVFIPRYHPLITYSLHGFFFCLFNQMELTHLIVFGTFLNVVKSAPTAYSQNPTPAGWKIEPSNEPRATRSYGTQLDYIFNVDWNKDLFKYFDAPLSYDLTHSTSYFATPTPFGFGLDYNNHGPTPETEQYQHYQEPLSQEEHYEEPYPDPDQYPPYAEPHLSTPHVYNVQLFFEDIPHVKLLLDNQKIRQSNHLQINNLGSLRMGHPFERSPNSDRKVNGYK